MTSPVEDPYLSISDEVIVVREAPEDRLVRGALLAFGVAPALVLAVWLVHALVAPSSGVALLGFAALAAGLGLTAGAAGVATMLRPSREAVTIDLAERLVTRIGAEPVVFRDPERVRVVRHRLGWRLMVDDLTLLARVPWTRGRALARTAGRLADELDAEAQVPGPATRAPSLVPERPRTLAALAYAPLDGALIGYSLFGLATSRHPKVRFAAKQSLLLLAVEAAVATAALLALAIGAAVLRGRLPATVLAAMLACPLVALALLRALVRIVAALRAYRGEVWVMPWLAPISRRWAPRPPERAPGPASADTPGAHGGAPARPAPRAAPPSSPSESRSGANRVGAGPWWT